ncbi:NOA36 family protein [Acanthocheilonema viteae]
MSVILSFVVTNEQTAPRVSKQIGDERQCDRCGREQRIRTVCCFCNTINEAPLCTVCGKQKRLVKNGDCINKHTGKCVIDQKSVLNEKHSTVENALKHFAKS